MEQLFDDHAQPWQQISLSIVLRLRYLRFPFFLPSLTLVLQHSVNTLIALIVSCPKLSQIYLGVLFFLKPSGASRRKCSGAWKMIHLKRSSFQRPSRMGFGSCLAQLSDSMFIKKLDSKCKLNTQDSNHFRKMCHATS